MKREEKKNGKRMKYLCLAVFIIYLLLLIGYSLIQAYSKPIIGGASMPTVLFTFRQTVRSRKGIFASCIGLPALVLFLAFAAGDRHRKRKSRRNTVQS